MDKIMDVFLVMDFEKSSLEEFRESILKEFFWLKTINLEYETLQ